MSAYLIALITPHNLDWLEDYQANVPKIVESYGGTYVALPKPTPGAVLVVEGEATAPASMVLFSFPSMQAITDFMKSPEYQPYRRARNAATESIFYAFANDDTAPQFLAENS